MKRLSRDEKVQIAVKDLINKMFEIAGYEVTYDDVKDRKDDWYAQWMMTVEQSEEWKDWGAKYLIKNLKMKKVQAEREMSWINLMWGLKYSNYEEHFNLKNDNK